MRPLARPVPARRGNLASPSMLPFDRGDPLGQVARARAPSGALGRQPVPPHPRRIGAARQQRLGSAPLPAMARRPERLRDVARRPPAAAPAPPRRAASAARRARPAAAPRATARTPTRRPAPSRRRSRRRAPRCPRPHRAAASITSTSSELAAQCSGVSVCGPFANGALTSAPASTSAADELEPLAAARPASRRPCAGASGSRRGARSPATGRRPAPRAGRPASARTGCAPK